MVVPSPFRTLARISASDRCAPWHLRARRAFSPSARRLAPCPTPSPYAPSCSRARSNKAVILADPFTLDACAAILRWYTPLHVAEDERSAGGAMSVHAVSVVSWAHSIVEKCQSHAAELLFQLSLSEAGNRALLAHPKCMTAIRHHAAESGARQSEVGKACAGALRGLEGVPRADAAASPRAAAGKHVMVSYQWDHQDMAVRVVGSLKQRGFAVWFDLEAMTGSTLDAMAAAVEGASCALLCISEKYKASASCRLEGNYVHEQRVPFVPLLVQDGYKASGECRSPPLPPSTHPRPCPCS